MDTHTGMRSDKQANHIIAKPGCIQNGFSLDVKWEDKKADQLL